MKIMLFVAFIVCVYTLFLYTFYGAQKIQAQSVQRKFMISESKNLEMHAQAKGTLLKGKSVGFERISLPGITSTKFGQMLIPFVLIGFFYGMKSKGIQMKLYYYMTGIFFFLMIVLTLSRSAIFPSIIGVLLFFYYRKKNISGLMTSAGITVILVLVFMLNTGAVDRAVQLMGSFDFLVKLDIVSRVMEDRNIMVETDQHISSYEAGYDLIKDAPVWGIFGIGNEAFWRVFNGLLSWARPHNRLMVILIIVGILPLFFYVTFLVTLILTIRKIIINKTFNIYDTDDLGTLFLPIIVAVIFGFSNSPSETYFYWIFFGLAAAWMRNIAYAKSLDEISVPEADSAK
ncbi:O-antigen ligase family protein [Fibrobacterota bacterium]